MSPDLDELRRLLADGTPGPWSTVSGAGNVWHFRDGGAPVVVAGHQCATPRVSDALLIAAAVNALPALLDAAAERDALRAELDALAAMLSGRCLSDITHRDEEHRQSVCMLPEGHAPLVHDDCMGCTWTDAEHWESHAPERLDAALHAIADESQHEGWDSPLVRRVLGRLRRAYDGEADR